MTALRRHAHALAPLHLLLALLAVFGGSFDFHSQHQGAGLGLSHGGGLAGGSYLETCRQSPEAHLETARPHHRPGCAVCLHRLQVSGGETAETPSVRTILVSPSKIVEGSSPLLARRLDPRTSRGPPTV